MRLIGCGSIRTDHYYPSEQVPKRALTTSSSSSSSAPSIVTRRSQTLLPQSDDAISTPLGQPFCATWMTGHTHTVRERESKRNDSISQLVILVNEKSQLRSLFKRLNLCVIHGGPNELRGACDYMHNKKNIRSRRCASRPIPFGRCWVNWLATSITRERDDNLSFFLGKSSIFFFRRDGERKTKTTVHM